MYVKSTGTLMSDVLTEYSRETCCPLYVTINSTIVYAALHMKIVDGKELVVVSIIQHNIKPIK